MGRMSKSWHFQTFLLQYCGVQLSIPPERGKWENGIHPKVNETRGFLYLGHSNWTVYGLLSWSCSINFPPFLLSYLGVQLSTGRMGWMAHRKLKEIKQQPGKAGPGNMLGCSLVAFHFRCDIHPICPVYLFSFFKNVYWINYRWEAVGRRSA